MLRRLLLTNGSHSIRKVPWIFPGQLRNISVLQRLRLKTLPTPSTIHVFRHFAHSPCFPNKGGFEEVCSETLNSLTDLFEELVESTDHLSGADVNYSDGVLTIQFGDPYGTYVINRQSPNEQIWLSSPTSGPKRYDFIKGSWIYRHDGVSLHELLSREISKIVKKDVDFKQCSHSQSSDN